MLNRIIISLLPKACNPQTHFRDNKAKPYPSKFKCLDNRASSQNFHPLQTSTQCNLLQWRNLRDVNKLRTNHYNFKKKSLNIGIMMIRSSQNHNIYHSIKLNSSKGMNMNKISQNIVCSQSATKNISGLFSNHHLTITQPNQ